jgi:hypothetical protein
VNIIRASFGSTKQSELTIRTLLTDGARAVRFERRTAG